VKIRFLIANAYCHGGTVRATINTANALADRHQVEIVSVHRRSQESSPYAVSPKVRMRVLIDLAPSAQRRDAARTGRLARSRIWAKHFALGRRSRLMNSHDVKQGNFSLLADYKIVKFLRSVDDGVLVATRPMLNLALARWGRPSVVRIAQEHMNLASHDKELRAAIRELFPRLDAVVTLTPSDARHYTSVLGSSTRILAIPNSVPRTDRDSAQLDSKVVITAGRLSRRKGFDRLVPAFAKVAAEHPEWHLQIFGEGPVRGQLQQQIDRLGMGANIHLKGYTSRLGDEMAASSMFVMSSRLEGFPMVLLEAIAHGLPIISFDCPTGPRDLISDGEDGLLVPDQDEGALAAAMERLITDRALRTSMGAAALAKSAQFEPASTALRWERLMDELSAAQRER
jgi:glycosyltransferase involved in cell wall biosynthesis